MGRVYLYYDSQSGPRRITQLEETLLPKLYFLQVHVLEEPHIAQVNPHLFNPTHQQQPLPAAHERSNQHPESSHHGLGERRPAHCQVLLSIILGQ